MTRLPGIEPLSVLLALAVAPPAHAYLDPASGSMILQAVLAAVAAGLFFINKYWQRIKDLLGGRRGRDEDSDVESS